MNNVDFLWLTFINVYLRAAIRLYYYNIDCILNLIIIFPSSFYSSDFFAIIISYIKNKFIACSHYNGV